MREKANNANKEPGIDQGIKTTGKLCTEFIIVCELRIYACESKF
jgi:hypothetical protein